MNKIQFRPDCSERIKATEPLASTMEARPLANVENYDIASEQSAATDLSDVEHLLVQAAERFPDGCFKGKYDRYLSGLQVAYELFLAIGDDKAKARHVLDHQTVKHRERKPSFKNRALFALIVVLQPAESDRAQCREFSYVLEVLRQRRVSVIEFAGAFQCTTTDACKQIVRDQRAAAKGIVRKPKNAVVKECCISQQDEKIDVTPWDYSSERPMLCLFRVDDKGSIPIFRIWTSEQASSQEKLATLVTQLVKQAAINHPNAEAAPCDVDGSLAARDQRAGSEERLQGKRKTGRETLKDWGDVAALLASRSPDK